MAGSDPWNMFLCTFQDVGVWKIWHVWKKTSVYIVFLTMILDLVLWICSYGPWDHFRFSVKSSIWLDFYQSDATCPRKYGFPDDCIFAKFHHAQGVSQPCARHLCSIWKPLGIIWKHLGAIWGHGGICSQKVLKTLVKHSKNENCDHFAWEWWTWHAPSTVNNSKNERARTTRRARRHFTSLHRTAARAPQCKHCLGNEPKRLSNINLLTKPPSPQPPKIELALQINEK